jgi:hypothetical protein
MGEVILGQLLMAANGEPNTMNMPEQCADVTA